MRSGLKTMGAWVVGIALVFGLGYLSVLWIKGPGKAGATAARQVEREVNQQSQQYVETQVRAMRDQIRQYEDNEVRLAELRKDAEGNKDLIAAVEAQQSGIIRFVATQVETLPDGAVPSDVSAFLSVNGGPR